MSNPIIPYTSKITRTIAYEIRTKYEKGNISYKSLASEYGCSIYLIQEIITKKKLV